MIRIRIRVPLCIQVLVILSSSVLQRCNIQHTEIEENVDFGLLMMASLPELHVISIDCHFGNEP